MRVCFQLQLKPDRIEEYRERHRAVWPEMLAALRDAGWQNYSLFLTPEARVIGYFETTSLEEAQRRMSETEVNALWQREMGEFFDQLDDHRPDEGFVRLEELFNLDDQLAHAEVQGSQT